MIIAIPVEYCIYHQTTIEEEYMALKYRAPSGNYDGYWVGYPNEEGRYPEQIVSNTILGIVVFQDITAHKKASALTDPLKLVKKSEETTEYRPEPPHEANDQGTRNTRIIRGKLQGIRCRAYLPTQDGNYAMVEFSTPRNLIRKTEWPSE